jgi:hypothetical protein
VEQRLRGRSEQSRVLPPWPPSPVPLSRSDQRRDASRVSAADTPARGCKPKPQKFPAGVERARIFPTIHLLGKVGGRNLRQRRTLAPPGVAHQASFSGKSVSGASAAGHLDVGGIFWGLGLHPLPAPSHLGQAGARHLGLLDDPCLLLRRPAPAHRSGYDLAPRVIIPVKHNDRPKPPCASAR